MNNDEWQRHVYALRTDVLAAHVTPQSILRRVRNINQEIPPVMDEIWLQRRDFRRQREEGAFTPNENDVTTHVAAEVPSESNVVMALFPDVTQEDARRALTENGGNLASAIVQINRTLPDQNALTQDGAIVQINRTLPDQNALVQDGNNEQPETVEMPETDEMSERLLQDTNEWAGETASSDSSSEETDAYPIGSGWRPTLRRQYPQRTTVPYASMTETAYGVANNILRHARHTLSNTSAERAYGAIRIVQDDLDVLAERLLPLREEERSPAQTQDVDDSTRNHENRPNDPVPSPLAVQRTNILNVQRQWLHNIRAWVEGNEDDTPPVNRSPRQIPETSGTFVRRFTTIPIEPPQLPPVNTLVKTNETRSKICELVELMEEAHVAFPDLQQPDSHFFCPLSLSAMHDPVVAVDGIMYENAWATRHMTTNGITSPTTRAPMHSSYLTRSTTMRSMMENWARATADALIKKKTLDELSFSPCAPSLSFLERMEIAIAFVKSRLLQNVD